MRPLVFGLLLASAACTSSSTPVQAPAPAPRPVAEDATPVTEEPAQHPIQLSMDDASSLPVPGTPAPYWTSEVVLTTDLACDDDLDCDLVTSPCACACPVVIRAGKRARRRAERDLAARCDAAPSACARCERPASTYRCESGVCVGVEMVLHQTY